MHKAEIAEQLLGLVTTQERAASMSGDLLETATGRSAIWFWSRLLRTAGALLWRSFMAEPIGLLAIGVLGLLLTLAINLLFLVIFSRSYLGVMSALSPAQRGRIFASPFFPGGFKALVFGFQFASQFWVGRWVARRAFGREVTVGVVLLAAVYAFTVLMAGFWSAHGIKPLSATYDVAAPLAILAGAVSIRRRAALPR